MSATSSSSPRLRAAAWLVFVSALAVRLVYVAGWGRGPGELVGDALDYHDYAVHLLDSGRYENSLGLKASRMPGYPLFLAGVYGTLGRGVAQVQAVQCVLGALTCLLIYLAARQWLGEKWALAAGIFSVFYYDLLSPCARLLTEAPTAFLVTLLFWLLGRRKRPSPGEAAVGGLIAGAAYFMRSELAPFIAASSAWLLSAGGGRARWKAPAALLAAFLLATLPWALRNKCALGRAVMATTAGSFNVYGWGIPLTIEERLGGVKDYYAAPESLGELAREDAYARAARAFYRAVKPSVLWRALAVNLLIFYYPFLPGYDPTFMLILPWALWGMWANRRDRRRWLWSGWIVYLTLLHCFVAVMGSRHRQKLASAFILLGFSGLKELKERLPAGFAPLVGAWAGANAVVCLFAPWFRQAALAFARILFKS